MDIYDESPINKAHYFSRKADNFEEKRLFDKSCEYHAIAASSLQEALALTNNELALECIQLQIQYHIKKQEILRLKKHQFLAIQEAVKLQKEIMSRVRRNSRRSECDEGSGTLQKAIYRNFETADSLLELLVSKKEADGETFSTESTQTVSSTGSKKPKDDSTVIEELRMVNYQLRSLITQLMTELAASEKQVHTLKQRVSELEATYVKPPVSASESFALSSLEELPPLETPCFKVDY